jgi:hypothetical protein
MKIYFLLFSKQRLSNGFVLAEDVAVTKNLLTVSNATSSPVHEILQRDIAKN